MSELDQLRQESEQLKNQIRVGRKHFLFIWLEFYSMKLALCWQEARKAAADTTLASLTEGYSVYTGQACTACHNAKGIYRIPEKEWLGIIADMAGKAQLSAAQKDALTKYVFAIKSTQPASK